MEKASSLCVQDTICHFNDNCRNPSLGLRPRQGGGCKVAGLVVDSGVTSHAPGSAKSPESVRE